MADQTVPTAIAVQAFLEAPGRVRVAGVGDRVALTFGDDLNGVRLMGDATHIHLQIIEADRQLTLYRNQGENTL